MKYNKILIVMLGVFVVGLGGGLALNNSGKLTPKISETEMQKKKDKHKDEREDIDYTDDDNDDDSDVVSEHVSQENKRIMYVSKSQIEAVTHQKVTFDNVEAVQKALEEDHVWQELGFSKTDAKHIASRVDKSSDQVRGILRGMSKKNSLDLKIILLEDGHVNLGKGNKND